MTEYATMQQVAPYPVELADLVAKLHYRRYLGWTIDLVDDAQRDKDRDGNVVGHGLTLVVLTKGYDTHHPEHGPIYRVYHYFIVPAATYNREAWQRWLFEQLCKVDVHEAMEDFVLREEGDFINSAGEHVDHREQRPFAPTHGPGDDPYVVHDYADKEKKHTRFNDLSGAIQTGDME